MKGVGKRGTKYSRYAFLNKPVRRRVKLFGEEYIISLVPEGEVRLRKKSHHKSQEGGVRFEDLLAITKVQVRERRLREKLAERSAQQHHVEECLCQACLPV